MALDIYFSNDKVCVPWNTMEWIHARFQKAKVRVPWNSTAYSYTISRCQIQHFSHLYHCATNYSKKSNI